MGCDQQARKSTNFNNVLIVCPIRMFRHVGHHDAFSRVSGRTTGTHANTDLEAVHRLVVNAWQTGADAMTETICFLIEQEDGTDHAR